jgi:hypothetical protein
MKTIQTKARLWAVVVTASTMLVSCGMIPACDGNGALADNSGAKVYKPTTTYLATLSPAPASDSSVALGSDGIFSFDPAKLLIYQYSLSGVYIKNIALPKTLDSSIVFSNSTHLGGGYSWTSRALELNKGCLYLLSFSTTKYLRYTLATDTWDTLSFSLSPSRNVLRQLVKNGNDGWVLKTCSYIIPHGYCDFMTMHLNEDFTTRHTDFSGDEGLDVYAGNSSSSNGIYVMDTSVSTSNYVFYSLNSSKSIWYVQYSLGSGYYIDADKKLYSFTLTFL